MGNVRSDVVVQQRAVPFKTFSKRIVSFKAALI